MRLSSGLTDKEFVTGVRTWMADHFQHDGEYRTLRVWEYTNLVKAASAMDETLTLSSHALSQENDSFSCSRSDIRREICAWFPGTLSDHCDDIDSVATNIRLFQKHCLEYFNESYHSIGEYMLLPLCTKNEMRKDELFLAVMEMMKQFGFVDCDDSGEMLVHEGLSWRRVFQYGDVLTIQKLHQLNP